MIQENLQAIKKTLPENVTLIAVSKTYPRNCIDEALLTHQMDFGENKVQEFLEKYQEEEKINWHFIGHLQTNKVKYLIGKVKLIHSVDSFHLLDVLEKESAKKDVCTHILLQVNLTYEKTKFGFKEEDIEKVIHSSYPHLSIDGLMVIGPTTTNEEDIEKVFIQAENLKNQYHFKELSMGMSQDYKIALKHAATMIRIGTTIFGQRDYSKK